MTIRHTRRAVLAMAGAAAVPAYAAGASGSLFRNTLSIGLGSEETLASGIRFSDGVRQAATPEALQRLFIAHGSKEIYTRIGTLRADQGNAAANSLERGLARARLAKSLGIGLNPEIGLWPSYGGMPDFRDYPAITPAKAWREMTAADMIPLVRDFGAAVAGEILSTGVTVRCWHLSGDERGIGGMTMPPMGPFVRKSTYQAPDGVDPEIGKVVPAQFEAMALADRIAWYRAHLWPHEGRVLAALAAGIRQADPGARFTTHIGSGPTPSYLPQLVTAFFTAMEEAGYYVDEPGICFFPAAIATPADRFKAFQASVSESHGRLGRPFYIAETGQPVAPAPQGNADSDAVVWDNPTPGYPLSPLGQYAITRDLVAWGARTGMIGGIRQWGPDSVQGGWAPLALFELNGMVATARPALDAVRDGLKRAGKI